MDNTKEELYKKDSRVKVRILKFLKSLIDGPDYLVRVVGVLFLLILGVVSVVGNSLFVSVGNSKTFEVTFPVWLGYIFLVFVLLSVVKGFREDFKMLRGIWISAEKKSETLE